MRRTGWCKILTWESWQRCGNLRGEKHVQKGRENKEFDGSWAIPMLVKAWITLSSPTEAKKNAANISFTGSTSFFTWAGKDFYICCFLFFFFPPLPPPPLSLPYLQYQFLCQHACTQMKTSAETRKEDGKGLPETARKRLHIYLLSRCRSLGSDHHSS